MREHWREAGADLVITSRKREALAAFEAEMKALGRRAVSLELDVRDEESIRKMAADAEAAFGQIHILVNNAGCNIRKPALEVTWADWNQILDTNLRGSFFVAQAVARGMIAKGYGRIINIGSVTSVFGYAGLAPYGASRGGVRQLTMSLADDWGKFGVTVNCLAPGWFRTEQNKVLYEDQEWVDYLIDRIPAETPRAAARSGRSGGVSGIGGKPVCERPDTAGGWRHLDWLNARDRRSSEAGVDRRTNFWLRNNKVRVGSDEELCGLAVGVLAFVDLRGRTFRRGHRCLLEAAARCGRTAGSIAARVSSIRQMGRGRACGGTG